MKVRVPSKIFSGGSDLGRLVERCRQNDPEAWTTLVQRHERLVYSIARRYRLNDDDAADVFQHTFQALLRSLDNITDPHTLPRWLAVTASREALKIRRISGRASLAEDHAMSLDEIIADESNSAEVNALESVRSECIRNSIADLPGRCRELLTLLYLEGDVAYAEVSDRMGIPVGAIGPTKARCLSKLRKTLEEEGFFE